MSSLRRWIITGAGTALGVGILAFLILFLLSRRDHTGDFRDRQGTLGRVSLEEYAADSLTTKSWLRLSSTSGLSVTCGMLVPRGPGRQYPAIIVLGGKATGKYAVEYALGVKNVVIVAPDYPYEPRGEYSVGDVVADLPAIRRAIFDMVPSVSLVTDYLWKRPDIDTTRLILMGYSFGAPFIPVIASRDRRAAVAVMVYGGGDVGSLVSHNVTRYEGPIIGAFVGGVSGLLLYPLEPLRHIENISPMPLLMVNGTEDEQIPRQNTIMLFDRAREPKRIIWIESRHVHPRNVDLTRRIISTIEAELAKEGILPPPDPSGLSRH